VGVKNYLRKCPYCNCYFFSKVDLKAHVSAIHGMAIDDVPPYNIEEEASRRVLANYTYKYRPASQGRCELCGNVEDVYEVGLEDGAVIHRCRFCLVDMMARMKRVRFIQVGRDESIRGSKRKVGALDRY